MAASSFRFRTPIPLILALLFGVAMILAVIWSGKSRTESRTATPGSTPDLVPPNAAVRADAVLLISLDGFSGAYLNPDDTPNLHGLLGEAAYSTRLLPPFPSLTFPSHVTLATGRTVSGHGIPANTFYDRERGEELRFPGDASLLRAEPIWTTATRQGLRVLSYDWPLSHNQTGPHAAAYFESRFDAALGDRERIGRVLDLWESDPDRQPEDAPLRLVTTYAKGADVTGHRHGPGAPETREAVREVDELIAETIDRAERIFAATREGDSQLYVILAADHGMAEVTHYVNIDLILGAELSGKVMVTSGGNVANLYLADPDAPDADTVLKAIDRAFGDLDYAAVHSAETISDSWQYPVEGRTGERIVTLSPGHTFSRTPARPRVPVGESGGLLGMHGYLAEQVPEMGGLLSVIRRPDPLTGPRDLGEVSSTRLHATISGLLGIEPAEGADRQTIGAEF